MDDTNYNTNDPWEALIKSTLNERTGYTEELFKKLNTDLKGVLDDTFNQPPDLWMQFTTNFMCAITSYTPVVGNALSYGVDFLFTLATYSKNNMDRLANTLSDQIKEVAAVTVENYDITSIAAFLRGIRSSIREFREVLKAYKDTLETNPLAKKFISNQYMITLDNIHSAIPHFRKDGFEIPEMSLFVQLAQAHLMFLTEGYINADKYGLPLEYTKHLYDEFEYRRYEYLDFLRKTFAINIAKVKTKDGSGADLRYDQIYSNRIAFTNKMILSVFDIANHWYALDPKVFPTGCAVEKIRYINSPIYGYPLTDSLNSYINFGNNNNYYKKSFLGGTVWEAIVPNYGNRIPAMQMKHGYINSATNNAEQVVVDPIIGDTTKYLDMQSNTPKTWNFPRNGEQVKTDAKASNYVSIGWRSEVFGIEGWGSRLGVVNKMEGHKVANVLPWGPVDPKISVRAVQVQFVKKDIRDDNIIVPKMSTEIHSQKFYTTSCPVTYWSDDTNHPGRQQLFINAGCSFDYYVSLALPEGVTSANFKVIFHLSVDRDTKIEITAGSTVAGTAQFNRAANYPAWYGNFLQDSGVTVTLSSGKHQLIRLKNTGTNPIYFESFFLRHEF
eukprot:gene10339-12694_t